MVISSSNLSPVPGLATLPFTKTLPLTSCLSQWSSFNQRRAFENLSNLIVFPGQKDIFPPFREKRIISFPAYCYHHEHRKRSMVFNPFLYLFSAFSSQNLPATKTVLLPSRFPKLSQVIWKGSSLKATFLTSLSRKEAKKNHSKSILLG